MAEFITVREAAIRLHKSDATIRRWLNLRMIEGIRMPSGTLLVRQSSIENILKQPI